MSVWLGFANGAWIAGLGLAGDMHARYAVVVALLAGSCAMLARSAGADGHRDGAETLAALCEREAGAAP